MKTILFGERIHQHFLLSRRKILRLLIPLTFLFHYRMQKEIKEQQQKSLKILKLEPMEMSIVKSLI